MPKKKETTEEFIIRWADTIVLDSNYKGEIERRSFMLDWVLSTKQPSQQEVNDWLNSASRKIREEAIKKFPEESKNDPLAGMRELAKYLDAVKKHLLNNGYIDEPKVTSLVWQLNDRGKLMKELRGHKKYKAHREKELLGEKKRYLKRSFYEEELAKKGFWVILGVVTTLILYVSKCSYEKWHTKQRTPIIKHQSPPPTTPKKKDTPHR